MGGFRSCGIDREGPAPAGSIGRVALQCDRGIADAACQEVVWGRATIVSMICLRVAQTVALECDPPSEIIAFCLLIIQNKKTSEIQRKVVKNDTFR